MEVLKTILCIAFFEIYLLLTAQCNGNQYGVCKNNTRFEKFCCSGYELKNGTCTKCLHGFHSEKKSICKPCTKGKYGEKCRNTCKCNSNERCDNIEGCIPDDTRTREKNDTSISNSQDTPTTSINGDVVIYMTCVAVGSVLVVVCGLLVKNKEAICKNKPGNNSVRHMIHKLKQPTFRDGRNKKVAENLYDDINEKYMINFDDE
ncbi:unnamed protein product [Mytilus coruscus]|uniref:MEGF10_11 n=1 Tax=Mytilus coruscus TaxID=42192 RepID=A0A6J8ADW7_MYTCO|nr:unnamed protein product [Mytilus coruscus]